MRTKLLALLYASLLTAVVVLPMQAHGQSDVKDGLTKIGGQINAGGGTGLFQSTDGVVTIIGKIIKILLIISGAIAVLFVIIGGFMYMTSAGNEEQATKGRKAIVNALIGIIIIILSYIIVNVIVNLVNCGGSFFGGC
jgi:hypothetical protein